MGLLDTTPRPALGPSTSPPYAIVPALAFCPASSALPHCNFHARPRTILTSHNLNLHTSQAEEEPALVWKYLDAMGSAAPPRAAGEGDGCWQRLTTEATRLVSPSVGKVGRQPYVCVCVFWGGGRGERRGGEEVGGV